MNESETMAQILKRTKKCCSKLFRKLTFSSSQSTSPNLPMRICGSGSSSARYVSHKNHRTQSITSTPQHSYGADSWTFDNPTLPVTSSNSNGISADEDEYQMFHISPNFFTKNSTNYSRVNVKSKKPFSTSTPKSPVSPSPASAGLMKVIWRKNDDSTKRTRNSPSAHAKQTTDADDDDILFTENKIYIGIEKRNPNELNKIRDSGNHSVSRKTSIRKRRNINGADAAILTPERMVRQFSGLDVGNGRSVSGGSTWGEHKNEMMMTNSERYGAATTTTTSFIVAQNLIEKFDSCLSLATNNFRNSLAPRIQYGVSPHQQRRVETTGSTVRCCRKLEFDENHWSENDKKEQVTRRGGVSSHYNVNDIVFEKVKYDSNKKYLRHTPANSCNSSAKSSPKFHNSQDLPLISIAKDISQSSIFSLENNLSYSDENLHMMEISVGSKSHKYDPCWASLKSVSTTNNTETQNCCNDFNGNNNPLANVTQAELMQRINAFNKNCPTPWDDNGNIYDSTKILYDDPWDVFDNKVNKARDRMFLVRNHPDDVDFYRLSPKSSSTTLETWVDDEILDNSFNEELERRCVSIGR